MDSVEVDAITCTAIVEADNRIVVTTLIRTFPPGREILLNCVSHTATCTTPPLAAGTWAVEYGDLEATVEAGATPEFAVCASPWNEPPVTETPL